MIDGMMSGGVMWAMGLVWLLVAVVGAGRQSGSGTPSVVEVRAGARPDHSH
jgi:hypothetical protein